MPQIGTGATLADARRPKYAAEMRAVPGAAYVAMDYGAEPLFLVSVKGIDTATHNTIAADATVAVLPLDLTQAVGAANLTNVQNQLETRNIPGAQLVTAATTYRQLIRAVIIIFQLAQRMDGMGYPSFFAASGFTLATTYSALPQSAKTVLVSMAESFRFNTSGISGSTTLRQLFKGMYDQWPAVSLFLGEAF